MHNLQIARTKYTLAVDFNADTGVLEMAGSSYPENTLEFFQPVFDWLEEFAAKPGQPVTLRLRLNYLNTSSSKCILEVLEIIGRRQQHGGSVVVRWHYGKDDADLLEIGKEFAEDTGLAFEMVPE